MRVVRTQDRHLVLLLLFPSHPITLDVSHDLRQKLLLLLKERMLRHPCLSFHFRLRPHTLGLSLHIRHPTVPALAPTRELLEPYGKISPTRRERVNVQLKEGQTISLRRAFVFFVRRCSCSSSCAGCSSRTHIVYFDLSCPACVRLRTCASTNNTGSFHYHSGFGRGFATHSTTAVIACSIRLSTR